jgi:CysZ protein
MILCLLFLLGGWVLFGIYTTDLIAWLWPEPSPDAWWGTKQILWSATSFLLWIILALATTVIAFVLFSLFAAPFSDLISERVEAILGTWTPRPVSLKFLITDLGQTVRLELRRVAIKAVWLIPLFLLSLILPVVGQAVYLLVGGYLLSKLTGMDFIDWCAARRGWSWKERLAFANQHRWAVTGLGTAVVLSLMIPLAFVIVWPGAVAGGAILFTSLQESRTDANTDPDKQDLNR